MSRPGGPIGPVGHPVGMATKTGRPIDLPTVVGTMALCAGIGIPVLNLLDKGLGVVIKIFMRVLGMAPRASGDRRGIAGKIGPMAVGRVTTVLAAPIGRRSMTAPVIGGRQRQPSGIRMGIVGVTGKTGHPCIPPRQVFSMTGLA